jgi:two-component system sensor histidine kinase KdpD
VRTVRDYAASLLATALSTLLAWVLAPWVALDSLVMIYLVGVVAVAARYGRGPASVAAIGASLAFDFFFTQPLFSLRISDPRLVITVGVMLLVGLVISALTAALRERRQAAIEHARHVGSLYLLTRDLARAADDTQVYEAARRHVGRAIGGEVLLVRPTDPNRPTVAEWVFQHQRRAGFGTAHYPDEDALYLPLVANHRALGVMIVSRPVPEARLTIRQLGFLRHCARQVAGALERERLVRAANSSERAAQEEQLRNSLLASVSHDLRQPLTLIESAAMSLMQGPEAPASPVYVERVRLLVSEARQMTDTVNKILDMTRLESAAIQLDRRWYPLETLIVGALDRARGCLSEHVVVADLAGPTHWVYVDELLFAKLLTNLLENAAKYSRPGSAITVCAEILDQALEIRVRDEGIGVAPGDTEAVFRKFSRGAPRSDVPGIGLGLSICRAIVELHGGEIRAQPRATAGTDFVIRLPVLPDAPAVPSDLEAVS